MHCRSSRPKILLVANWDWVSYNFRLPLARALRANGAEVVFVCPPGDYSSALQQAGFRWIPWHLRRHGLNPVSELAAVRQLAGIYRDEVPSLVHHDTIKPNLYGPLAIRLNTLLRRDQPVPATVLCFMGIGFLFSRDRRARVLRALVIRLLRYALRFRYVHVVFSNAEDLERFQKLRILGDGNRTRLLVSEFVDTDLFHPATPRSGEQKNIVVLLAARALWDKGVGEFVEAARQLRARPSLVAFQFWYAGISDPGNPRAIPEHQLRSWEREGVIRWLRQHPDMPTILREANIAVLPTHYNEGLPRFLVEAAAAGLPLVASNIRACAHVVRHGQTGFLVHPGDISGLVDVIGTLGRDAGLRDRLGRAAREMAVREFGLTHGVEQWLDFYEELLSSTAARMSVDRPRLGP